MKALCKLVHMNESTASFLLDLDDERLWCGQESVELTPKAFAVLRYMLSKPNQLVTQQELLDKIWPNVCVGDDTVRHYIHELRKMLRDDALAPRFIATVRGRGYRFIGFLPTKQKPTNVNNILSLLDKPSIAVLPFTNLSDDSAQEYFCEGISDDLITDLCKLRDLFVIARHSSFFYKNKVIDIRLIGLELGVHYVLEGSVRKKNEYLRVNAQLIDTSNGKYIWAELYDSPLVDFFAIQDEIRDDVISALNIKLIEGEQARIWRRTTNSIEAYQFFCRPDDSFLLKDFRIMHILKLNIY